MKKLLIALVAISTISLTTDAQRRTCSTMQYYEMSIQKNPSLELKMMDDEKRIREWMKQHPVVSIESQSIHLPSVTGFVPTGNLNADRITYAKAKEAYLDYTGFRQLAIKIDEATLTTAREQKEKHIHSLHNKNVTMKNHIRKTIFLFASILTTEFASAQCANDNTIYLTGPAPTVVGSTVTAPDTWGGEFNRVTSMQAGYTYEISTCNDATFDSEITIYPAGGTAAVAHDDDGCGTVGGASKIIFTPVTTGDYDILLDAYGCLSNSIDMDVDIKLVSTGGSGPGPASVTIPVVVHVIYKNTTENVSDAQIMSQIDALNRDYRKINADFSLVPAAYQSLGADMDIAFCLASIDPNGSATNGITRTSTTIQSFDHSNEPKSTATGGHENWDPTKYLNLWVCDLTGGLLGYATFPTNLATDPQLDGVVVDYACFGTIGTAIAPFHLGRTATHEVGHWLNLRHIWGDANCGDDFVNDTPTQQQANTGCPSFPTVTCSNGPNGDLFMDYMDYSDDACLLLFTMGQKQRTDATLATLRTGLATSNGCGNTTGISVPSATAFQLFPNPASESFTVQFGNEENYTVTVFDVNGKMVYASEIIKDKITVPISAWANGLYYAQFRNNTGTLVKKLAIQH